MKGDDGRRKIFIDRKFVLYFLTIVMFIIIIIIWSNHRRPYAFQNCDQIKVATGRSFIHKGDRLYQSRLDPNHNSIACE